MVVRRYGDGDTQVLYLHGLGEAGGIFDVLLTTPELATGSFTHVVPDLPGYGRSAWPASPVGLAGLAEQLVEWLADFPSVPVLVGHSMGGVLAVLIAEKAPKVIKAVVNIEGNISLGDCTFSGRVASWSEAEYVRTGHAETAQVVYDMGADIQPARYYYAAFRFADPASTHRHARDLVDVSQTESLAGRMAALRVPSVFVAGVPRGIAERSLELLDASGVRTVQVEPAGHWVYVDDPTACAEVIIGLI
jgi:pimeloyl-ACP methyl ester carboxylesterase